MTEKKKSNKRRHELSVGEFYKRYGDELGLSLQGSDVGFDRLIKEPTINRPGLVLAGFYTYFAFKRIQVIGNSENSYLKSLTASQRTKQFTDLCNRKIPCIVISRGYEIPKELLEIAERKGISILKTKMISMKFINAATIRLEWDFAPITSEHGCMVDVQGIGVMVRGDSGTGKSECVLGLIERGASLVADDIVRYRSIEGRELIGTSPSMGRFHMEVRGLGIINVPRIFGVASMRVEKRLDLVVTLRSVEKIQDIERVGIRKKNYEILNIKVPHIELPVAPGRDMAGLVEVAALDQKLKTFGHDSAIEFDKKLLKTIAEKRIG
ncbi:MAG: HPr(Ser) kinase/phosphatase [Verrucomicrobiales bacterium]|nr:MAG: HPr(Ser) kinase/phosphatase [Verrucomicrobiaceae bacterium]